MTCIKFTVLLPTRNRLEYLRYAITSVLEQDYENWEIIVSDNFSEEDIEGYVSSLNDKRIKFFRTSSFVPVTENWNNALNQSTGDYVIMLGDDDSLLRGYFRTCLDLLQAHHLPELLYTSAYLYAYPEVLPDQPNGYLHTWENACFLSNKSSPYLLDKQTRFNLVKKTLNFNVMFNFNAQFSLVSRALITRLQSYGPFYQSPYPDYYSTTVMMLKADSVLAVPNRLVVVGISPKSFGYYYFNNKEQLGNEMLKNIPEEKIYLNLKKVLLPGSNMNSSWLFSMECIKNNFKNEFKLSVNYKKYRLLQTLHIYKGYVCKEETSFRELIKNTKKLKIWEKFAYCIPLQILAKLIHLRYDGNKRKEWFNRLLYSFSHPSHGSSKRIEIQSKNILDVFRKI